MKLINENPSLGVKLPRIQAENSRLQLIKAGLLSKTKKIIRNHNYVYFPITDSSNITKILKDYEYQLDYFDFPEENLKPKVIDKLRSSFPNEPWNEISIKFDQIGEIGLLRLDPQKTTREFRIQVGNEILNSYPKITSVLNKSDITEGINRIFPIEHLAGEKKFESWHKEYGVLIKVDLQRAYFNPRLAEEHRRLSKEVKSGDRILDLFAGVGPFSLHCAKATNCTSIAVDINPYAIQNLTTSINRNKLNGTIIPIIGDAGSIFGIKNYFDRIIMNLPDSSIEYLEYSMNLVKNGGIITFYQFIRKMDKPDEFISALISKQLGKKCDYEILTCRVGREVSPSKVQMNVDLNILKNG